MFERGHANALIARKQKFKDTLDLNPDHFLLQPVGFNTYTWIRLGRCRTRVITAIV